MKKDKNKVVERLRNRIKPENRVFVKKNIAIVQQIQHILNKLEWSQKELADKLGKHESEVSRWLTGLHNLTLDSLSKIEAALGEEVITTPLEACEKYHEIKYVLMGYEFPNLPEQVEESGFDEAGQWGQGTFQLKAS